MKYRVIITLLALLTGGLSITAQRQPLYSQFTFNRFLFNPASAGSENTTMIKATVYEQWVGFKDAPSFYNVSFDSRVFKDSKNPRRNIRKRFKIIKPGSIGAGAYVFSEQYGALSHTGFSATYSYHMKLENQQLSFGISPVISNLGLNSSEIQPGDETFDALLDGDKTRRWIMDFNAGIYLSASKYFLGYSVQQLTASGLQWGGSLESDYQLKRQHYLMAGYRLDASSDLSVEPAALVRIPEGDQVQMDISVQGTYKEDYWFGLSYKTTSLMSVFGGLQVDRYYFCYAFDYNFSEVGTYSYGSHEIMLGVQLGESTRRYRWLNEY